ncbi:biotin transporter BioY [Rubellimicrobium roseum]|uniref:Biotin transporter n=1 Tax=Rubellimicrobium roseum TaxID=687525 RepID=A0A5C4NJQ1_9RHOB|nr:biotin transporter BioY [Rubellimicrobium roseum]TNC74190.1 biotin transporter BioY [Rubellimicrobium roseum]
MTPVTLSAPGRSRAGWLVPVAVVLGGSWLLALSARISVPMAPVPMTLQTLALLVLAGGLGLRLGTATVLAYLGQGALGLPVFAAGGGLAYMMGPTGGFLLGFLLAAMLIGWAVDRGATRHGLLLLAALTLGHALVFVPGVLWLATFTGLPEAWAKGAAPFLLGSAVKTALALMLLLAGQKLTRRIGGL